MGLIKGSLLKDKIIQIIELWKSWKAFNQNFLDSMKALLVKPDTIDLLGYEELDFYKDDLIRQNLENFNRIISHHCIREDINKEKKIDSLLWIRYYNLQKVIQNLF